MKNNKEIVGCCVDFKAAQEPCSDNEGYGRLIGFWDDEWNIGTSLRPVVYCPWCGSKVITASRIESVDLDAHRELEKRVAALERLPTNSREIFKREQEGEFIP